MLLSALAYNIRFGHKLKNIQDWILNYPKQFDIVCLQEFPFDKKAGILKNFEKHDYGYSFAPSFSKRGKQYGEITFYKKHKIKLLKSKAINLGTNLLERRSYKKNGEKSAMLTHMSYKGKKFIMANSHLFTFALNSHRINQLSKIIDQINKTMEDKKTTSIILGDFNYSSILRQKSLMDFMNEHEFTNAYKAHTHKLFFLKQQLDYVFYKNCKVDDIVISKKIKFSDHYPVQFTFSLDENKKVVRK
jgi:endonuclease/exonuclease/phosphatase family metal-dependent hydrolase